MIISDRFNKVVAFGKDYLTTLSKLYPLYTFSPEVQVYDEELGLAGTVDLVIEGGGRVVLVDYKTNDKITTKSYDGKVGILPPTRDMEDCSMSRYSLQLSLYAYILERRGCFIDKLYIIHLSEKGAKEIEVPYLKERVEKMLTYSGKLITGGDNNTGGE